MIDPAHLAEHVKDANYFELPFRKIYLPEVFGFQI